MGATLLVLIVLCLPLAELTHHAEEGCRIELQCGECLPEHMPAVTSHAADDGGELRLASGASAALSCGAGRFLLYPLRAALAVRCSRGAYLVLHDNSSRALLELGCQRAVHEDVLHAVPHCAPPLEGRAYQARGEAGRVDHLAALCFDPQAGVAAHALVGGAALELPPHEHRASPLSLLGNFGEMFDADARRFAERLYSDDAALERRVRATFERERFAFAGQTLTAARLLAPRYFPAERRPVAEFASNKVAAWRSVATGNLRLLQADAAALLRRAPALRVYAGTHGVMWLGAGATRREVFLREGRRFPVPRYVWTALVAADGGAGVALVLLNDPFVTVSDIREAVFCESSCQEVEWLAELTRHRNYERPINGLVFCCDLPAFAARVPEMPRVFNASVARLNRI